MGLTFDSTPPTLTGATWGMIMIVWLCGTYCAIQLQCSPMYSLHSAHRTLSHSNSKPPPPLSRLLSPHPGNNRTNYPYQLSLLTTLPLFQPPPATPIPDFQPHNHTTSTKTTILNPHTNNPRTATLPPLPLHSSRTPQPQGSPPPSPKPRLFPTQSASSYANAALTASRRAVEEGYGVCETGEKASLKRGRGRRGDVET